MDRYEYRGRLYTPKQLSEMSGIAVHTIRDRLRRGYSVEESVKQLPVHDSVKEFCESSYYHDWIGMAMSDVYAIYYKWCTSNGYTIVSKQAFTRHIMSIYSMLKIIPTKRGEKYQRVIRMI